MRNFLILLLLIPFACPLYAQVHPDGDPVETSFQMDPIEFKPESRNDLFELECGDTVEGDYIAEMCFSQDGNLVLVPHRTTNNISVIDWETQTVIENIPVGISPMQVKATEDYAIVACLGSDDAYIIDLSDYSIAAVFATGPDPISVRVNQTGTHAAIGSDLLDNATIIDLQNLSVVSTIPGVEVGLTDFSFITSNPRNSVAASDFVLTNQPPYFMYPAGTDGIAVVDATNGTALDTVYGVGAVNYMRLSPDGSYVLTMDEGNEGQLSRIDAASLQLLETFTMPMDMSLVGGFGDRFGMNTDGTKIYTGIGGNEAAIINLTTSNLKILPNIGSPDWVGNTGDGKYAISGDYFFSLIDFDSESVAETIEGIPHLTGAVAPVGFHIISSHPIRYEGLYYYNIQDNIIDLEYLGSSATGSALEADASYSANITPDESQVIVVNNLSRTLSIIDLETKALTDIVPLGDSEVFLSAITADSRYALVSLRLINRFAIVDLQTAEVIGLVNSSGQRPGQILIDENNTVFVANVGSGDNIARFEFNNGVASFQNFFTGIGNLGVSWTNYGIYSNLVFTPDQSKIIVASSFTDELIVLDAQSGQVLQNIPTGSFPLEIEWSADGEVLLLTCKNQDAVQLGFYDGNTVALLSPIDVPANVTRAAFNPLDSTFAICSNDENRLTYLNYLEGEIESTQLFGDYTPIAVDYGPGGEEWVLLRATSGSGLPHQLQVGSNRFDLPALPIHHYDRSEDGRIVAIPHPGSDQLSIFEFQSLDVSQSAVSLKPTGAYRTSPNPVAHVVQFDYLKTQAPQEVSCLLFDLQGKRVARFNGLEGRQFKLSLDKLPTGLYAYSIKSDDRLIANGKILKR